MSGWVRIRIAAGVLVIVAATAAIITGLVATAAAAGLYTVVGRSGVLSQDLGTVEASAPEVAVLIDGVEASVSAQGVPPSVEDALVLFGTDTDALVKTYGDFVLLATPQDNGDVFLGIAPPAEVDAYLDGAGYAVAERAPDGGWLAVGVPGAARPAAPGTAVTWSAASSGRPAQLDAGGLAGRTLVVMRPDAEPGLRADLRLEYRVPRAPQALRASALTAASASVGGLLLLLLGSWLVVGPRPAGRHT